MIPVYCMEEHHEAFFYWGLAADKGMISREGNTLFHVDHHDDLEYGGYDWDFTKPIADLEERKRFVYEKLGIADFIVPALYEGLFSQMYNMKSVVPKKFQQQERFVRRVGVNALTMGDYIPFLHGRYRREKKEGYQFFTYFEGSLSPVGELQNVVLDIDLDYFCWDDALRTVPAKQVEITEEAYREYRENPYHPFRILPRRLIRAEEKNGRYFLVYEEPFVYEKKADKERIIRRIDRFLSWLREVEVTPKVITICRSAKSGYLPSPYAELVEKSVRNGLETIYQLDYQKEI